MEKKENIEPNVMATLTYLIPIVISIVALYSDKDNKFVKFHAYQSIFFWCAIFAGLVLSDFLRIIWIGYLTGRVISIGGFIVWLILMFKAFNNQEWELPYFGKFAKQHSQK